MHGGFKRLVNPATTITPEQIEKWRIAREERELTKADIRREQQAVKKIRKL